MTDDAPRALIRSELPRYGRLPRNLLRDPDVPDRAVRLFGLLDDYADADGLAFPSRARLAAAMGCSVDSVDRAVKALERAGWLRREVRRRADRTYDSTLYTLTFGGSRTGAATSRTGAEGVAAPVRTEGTPEKENHNNTPQPPKGGGVDQPALVDVPHVGGQTRDTGAVKPRKAPAVREVADDDPDWSRFWSTYPRRQGKGAARRAWSKAIRKTPPGVIIAGLEAQLPALAREVRDGQDYRPHASTWLNGERWTDEHSTPAAAAAAYEHGEGAARVLTADQWAKETRHG